MINETFRNLRWADYLIFALTNPRELSRRIQNAEKPPYILCCFIFLLISLASLLSAILPVPQTEFFYYRISYGWIFHILLFILQIVIAASVMDLAGQLFGYKGQARSLFILLVLAQFPRAFSLPLTVIVNSAGFAPLFFYSLIEILLFVWSLFISVLAISELHQISAGRSFFIFASPYLIVGGLGFFMALLGFVQLAAFISHLA